MPERVSSSKAPFLWGVATSAYQAEGNYNAPDQPRSNWASAEEKGDVAVLGASADFLHRYLEDFDRCQKMGLNAFRLGIEWTRLQPQAPVGNAEPVFDQAALQFYADLLIQCRQRKMEPVVTLHHFVHPAWLGSDAWLDERTIEFFVRYVETALTFVNQKLAAAGQPPIRYLITINEPNMLVLNSYLGRQFPVGGPAGFKNCLQAYDVLLASHVRAYHLIHRLYRENGWPEPRVTLNNYCSDLYWSDKFLLDLLSIRERGIPAEKLNDYFHTKAREFDQAFLDARIPLKKNAPYYFGAMIKRLSNWIGYRTFRAVRFPLALREIFAGPTVRTFDYIGLDYYDPFAAHAFRLPVWWDHEFKSKSFREWIMSSITSKWWDWRVLARGMNFFCSYYSRDLAGREILIAENGMAVRRKKNNETSHRPDQMSRSQFLRLHVHEVVKIVNDQVPLIGYLHWSLFDNYEWGSYTPRFGLFSIDYQRGTERLPVDTTGDNPSETYAQLVAEARAQAQRES